MNTRASYTRKLEKALFQAIKEQDTAGAEQLITTFDAYPNVELYIRDQEGRTFLHAALAVGLINPANMLLSRLKENPVIFLLDKKQRSLIWYAAACGQYQFIHELMQIAKKEKENSPEYKIWLIPDYEHITPLVKAIESNSLKTVSLLLAAIQQEENALDIIHQCDKDGETALHTACRFKILDMIALLFKNGSDLMIANNKNETAFSIISHFTVDEQMTIFQFLGNDIEAKKKFLKAYYTQLTQHDHADQELAKQFYFKASSTLSLQALAAAHLEFNRKIKLRTTCQIVIARTKSIYSDKGKGKEKVRDTDQPRYKSPLLQPLPIPTEILAQIPQYADRIGRSIIKSKDHQHQPNYLLVNQDRITLINLIKDINAYLSSLQRRSTISYSTRLTMVASILLWHLLTIAVAAYFGLQIWLYNNSISELEDLYLDDKIANDEYISLRRDLINEKEKYTIITAFGIALPFFLDPILAVCGILEWLIRDQSTLINCWNKERKISKREYQHLYMALKKQVWDQLQYLEKNDIALPTAPENRKAIKKAIHILMQDQPLQKIKKILLKTESSLKTILRDMDHTHRPLTFFKPIKQTDNELDEIELSLMPSLKEVAKEANDDPYALEEEALLYGEKEAVAVTHRHT